MANLILYGLDPSAPTRACLLTLKALELPFEYVIVNLMNKEHLSEAYLAKNPQHTVPTLEDDGNFISESHAINAYLVSKYGKPEHEYLYPKDLLKRARVDQRLYFDASVFFEGVLKSIVQPLLFEKNPNIPLARIDANIAVYDLMEKFLQNTDYVAGHTMTIADFSLISTMGSSQAWLEVDADKYPKLAAWIKRMHELPYYDEACGNGAAQFVGMIKANNPVIVP